jgi:hypothetical protein
MGIDVGAGLGGSVAATGDCVGTAVSTHSLRLNLMSEKVTSQVSIVAA